MSDQFGGGCLCGAVRFVADCGWERHLAEERLEPRLPPFSPPLSTVDRGMDQYETKIRDISI
jgi:hypothetical protein